MADPISSVFHYNSYRQGGDGHGETYERRGSEMIRVTITLNRKGLRLTITIEKAAEAGNI